MGYGRELYFWIAISSLPGYQQFLPLDKVSPGLEKQAFLGQVGPSNGGTLGALYDLLSLTHAGGAPAPHLQRLCSV
jgi:hypothetical protein